MISGPHPQLYPGGRDSWKDNVWVLAHPNNLKTKGGFFSESAMCFFKSPKKIFPKNYPELEI